MPRNNTKEEPLPRDKGAYFPKTRSGKMKRHTSNEEELVKKPIKRNKTLCSPPAMPLLPAAMPLSPPAMPLLPTCKMMPSSPCLSPRYDPTSAMPESPRETFDFKPLEKEDEKRAIDFFSEYLGVALEVTGIEVEDSHLKNGSAYLTISISQTPNVMRLWPTKIFYNISNIECNYPESGCYGSPTFLDYARGRVTYYVTSPKKIHGDLECNYHFGDILQKVVEIAGYKSMLCLNGETVFRENKAIGSMVPALHKIKLVISLKPYSIW